MKSKPAERESHKIKKIIHLTHADTVGDSRIEKAHALAIEMGLSSKVIGVWKSGQSRKFEKDRLPIRIWAILFRLPPIIVFIEVNLRVFIRGIIHRPDLIHCNDWYVLPSAVGIKAFTNARLLYDAHELESEVNMIRPRASKMVLWVEKFAWKYVDYFLTVSFSIQSWYLKKFGSKPSEIVLNSPDFPPLPIKNEKSDYFRQLYAVEKGTPVFLYVGYLESGRGINLILDVFANTNSSAVAVFLGEGPLLEKISEASRVRPNVFVHPMVDHSKVVSLAASADFGLCLIENVSLSDFYCLPNKLFEYAFANLPVLASDFPDLSRVVNEFGLGVCIEPSLEGLESFLVRAGQASSGDPQQSKSLEKLSWPSQRLKLQHAYSILQSDDLNKLE
jgi:glycosyltransferase involved in cell wall biosynthesis